MKVNRIRFAYILQRWRDLQGEVNALRALERYDEGFIAPHEPPNEYIMDNDGTGWRIDPDDPRPERVPMTEKQKVYAEARKIRKSLDRAIRDEKYEDAAILQEIIDVLKIRWNKL